MPLLAKLTGKLICKVRAPVTDIEGRALMIYITHPFKRNTNRRHTNMQESIAMADVLAELGLVVDVMDFRNPYRIKLDHYDLIVGFGDVFEKLFYEKNKAIKVHYATGAPQSVHCFAEVSRIQHLRANRKLKVYPKRVLDRSWPCSELLSDAIISVTDGWAKRQFQMRNTNVYSVPITSLSKVSRVDIDLANKLPNHFVWFGSLGAVHKGLDLVLEAFAKIPVQ